LSNSDLRSFGSLVLVADDVEHHEVELRGLT
jgi:hypothetical protein